MYEFRYRRFWRKPLIACMLSSTGAAYAGSLGDALQATLNNHPAVVGQQALSPIWDQVNMWVN